VATRAIYTEMGLGAGPIDDPYRLFAELRRETPVRSGDVMVEFGAPSFLAPEDSRPKFTLFRYDDMVRALRDAESFSSRFWEEPGAREQPAGMTMDGIDHRSWRTLLTPVFGRKAVAVADRQIIQPITQRFAESIAANGNRADLVGYAHRFPMEITYELVGLEDDGAGSFDRFEELALTSVLAIHANPDPELRARNTARAKQAGDELLEWVTATVSRRRAEGATGTDLISHAIRSERASGRIDDSQIAMFIRTIASGAVDNTSRQFLNTLTCLLERPELLDAVRNDRTLLPLALLEAERYETPALTAPRITTREMEIGGTAIPADAFILLVLASANRDPAAFADPDTFDIDRQGPTPLTFGLGRHLCPGINTARAEIGAAIGALLDRLPNLRADPDREPPRLVGAPVRRPQTLPVVWD
jgi:cytochrome P450